MAKLELNKIYYVENQPYFGFSLLNDWKTDLAPGPLQFKEYNLGLNNAKIRRIELYYSSILCGMILYGAGNKEIK